MVIKKGSAAAKAWGAKMKRLRNKARSKSKPKKRKSSTIKYKPQKNRMAKRRKTTKKRSAKRSASLFGINSAKAISAMIYGAVRMKTSGMIAPYTSKIPLGNVSDEAGMLVVTTLGKKYLFKRAGTMRDALTAGQTIELARIGEAIISGQVGNILGGLMGNSGNAASSGYQFA